MVQKPIYLEEYINYKPKIIMDEFFISKQITPKFQVSGFSW